MGYGYGNGCDAYKKANVRTASQGQLVVLLYEGAERELSTAADLVSEDGAVAAKDIEKFSGCLQKAQAIITELQVSLDMESGGDIAKNLMSLYVYFNNELMEANISHDKKKIEFTRKMIGELCGAWRQAAASAENASAASMSPALNIEG